jgi:hypothetical protein
VPWYGEIPFLFDRLGLTAEKLQPRALPSPQEVRGEYLRRRDSPQLTDRRVAGHIAAAVGAAVLTPDDVLPLMRSNAIDDDLAREVGYAQFCSHIDRLCDFSEQMVAVCKEKRGTPERLRRYPGITKRCDEIPAQCALCRRQTFCQPYLTGSNAGCSPAERAANEAALQPLRPH